MLLLNEKINLTWQQLLETPYHVLRVLNKKVSDKLNDEIKNKVDYDVAIIKATSKSGNGMCPFLTKKR